MNYVALKNNSLCLLVWILCQNNNEEKSIKRVKKLVIHYHECIIKNSLSLNIFKTCWYVGKDVCYIWGGWFGVIETIYYFIEIVPM